MKTYRNPVILLFFGVLVILSGCAVTENGFPDDAAMVAASEALMKREAEIQKRSPTGVMVRKADLVVEYQGRDNILFTDSRIKKPIRIRLDDLRARLEAWPTKRKKSAVIIEPYMILELPNVVSEGECILRMENDVGQVGFKRVTVLTRRNGRFIESTKDDLLKRKFSAE